MIEILTPAQVDRARRTGALVADILQSLKERSEVGTNLLHLDRWTAEMITAAGAESCYVDYAPSFGRGPFGHYVCTAVNDAVLHGRPRDQRGPPAQPPRSPPCPACTVQRRSRRCAP